MKAFNRGKIISIILFIVTNIFAVNVWSVYTDTTYTCPDRNESAITINFQVPGNDTVHKVVLGFNTDSSSIAPASYAVTVPGEGSSRSISPGAAYDIDTNPGDPNSGKSIRLREFPAGSGDLTLSIFEKPTNPPRGTVNGGGVETWNFTVSVLDTPYSVDGVVTSYDANLDAITPGDGATISSDPCPVVNQPPTIDPISSPQSATVGTLLTITVVSHDSDNPPATLSAPISPSPTGTNNFVDNGDGTGAFSFTPVAADAGQTFTVTFTAMDKDDAALLTTIPVAINVGEINDPPTIDPIPSPQSATVGTLLTIPVVSQDLDNPPATLSAPISPSPTGTNNFVDNGNGTGSFTFTPNAADSGETFTVTFTATDKDDVALQTTLTVVINVSRAPKEVMLVVDHSGTMIGEKWDTAVTAANTFVNLLYQLNLEFTDDNKDKVGVVSYSSDTGSNSSWTYGVTHADAIETRPLDIPPAGLDINSLWPAQIFDMTPTGEGLMTAINTFENSAPPDGTENEKYILLLTDGQNNAGYYTIDDFVTAFNSHANPQINALKVYSVVIGDDSYIWPERIAQLSVVDSHGEYRVTDDPVILPEFFAQILGNIVIAEEILPNTSLGGFCADAPVGSYCTGGEDKVALIATWDRSEGGPYYLKVNHTPSPQEINPTNYSTFINVKKSYTLLTDSYTFYILEETADVPGPGEQKAELGGNSAWSLRLVNDLNAPVIVPSARFFVLHDLKVRTNFSFDRKKHGTGDRIVFKAEIKESGQPVLNAKVKVNIKRPGEGAGELMFITPPPPSIVSHKAANEGLSPIFLHMKEVFKALNRDKLLELGNEVSLQDNGTGVYTGVFSDLRYEGNYTFKFTAKGTSPQNRTFARTKTISQFVKVNVEPALSKLTYWVNPRILDGRIRELWVLYEPVDKFGSHLGPYRNDYLKYEFTGGKPQDKIEYSFDREDTKGGKYYQRILFNDRKELPRVTVKYQGNPIGKQLSLRTFNRFEISLNGGLFANYRINAEKEFKFSDTAPVYLFRFAYNPRKIYGLEANVGITPTTNNLGDKGRLIQFGVNGYYNFPEILSYKVTPFFTLGVGAFLYRGFGEDDESFTWNIGGGFKYSLGKGFDLRYDIRHFMSFGVYGSNARNHLQTTAGIVFSLK